MHCRKVHFDIILLLLLASCAQPAVNPSIEGDKLPFETLSQTGLGDWGTYFDSKDPNIMVVASPDETAQLIGTNGDSLLQYVSTLDYGRYFVVFVNRGRQGYIGFNTTIDAISRSGDVVNVYVTFTDPKPDQPVGAMESDAYHLVKVEKTGDWNRDIRFNLIVQDQNLVSLTHFIP
jgi:hypothetical protein